jgi:hypothetical protein
MGHQIDTIRESENLFRFVLIVEAEKGYAVSSFEQRRRSEETVAMPPFSGGAA